MFDNDRRSTSCWHPYQPKSIRPSAPGATATAAETASPIVGFQSRRSRPRRLAGALLSAAFAAACANPHYVHHDRPAYQVPTTVSSAVTFAAPQLSPDTEVELLAKEHTTAAVLRRAYVELVRRRPDATLDATAEVLYAPTKPSAHEEAFARFLRSEAFRQQGYPSRGEFDRQRAQALALDPGLQRRLAGKRATKRQRQVGANPWGPLPVQPRSTWRPLNPNPRNLDGMRRPTRVTIHHSAMYFRDTQPRACAAQIQLIQRAHMQSRGYGDIGYHFLIDPSGRVWEGRQLHWQGAHASGANNIGNIGICVLGNFVRQRRGQGPTKRQVVAMRSLVAQLMDHYRFGPNALYCHSDFKPTECPGPLMAPLVQQFARELRTRAGAVAAAADD